MNQQVALVTGASHGFGKAIAQRLTQAGYIVYGTSRSARPDMDSVRMRVLELTDAASVAACVEGIRAEAGRIDLLVNNAGRLQLSLLEEAPLEDVDLLFQTNFLGVARVTNAVLPIIRRQRAGRVIIIGSLNGLIGISGMGYTSAIKHALEGYAEALKLEVEGFGIQVSIVEPSFFKTDVYERRIESDILRIDDYDSLRTIIHAGLEKDSRAGDDPALVAEKVLEIARAPQPRLRYTVGKSAAMLATMKRLMPERWFLSGLRSRLK
jgi:NAD(P)-dependent dehydrogenase (short-subunit alcohol dehydrogenase family)